MAGDADVELLLILFFPPPQIKRRSGKLNPTGRRAALES